MSVILTSKHHCKETLNVKNNSEFDFDRSFAPPSDVFESLQGRKAFIFVKGVFIFIKGSLKNCVFSTLLVRDHAVSTCVV